MERNVLRSEFPWKLSVLILSLVIDPVLYKNENILANTPDLFYGTEFCIFLILSIGNHPSS